MGTSFRHKPRRQDESGDMRKRLSGETAIDVARLIQELRTHQAELETQNEALRLAQVDLQQSKAEHQQLADMAPVPYLRLGRDTTVRYANAAALALLGNQPNRPGVLSRRFSSYVASADVSRFDLYRREVLSSDTRQQLVCDVSLNIGEHSRQVRLYSRRDLGVHGLDGDPRSGWLMAIVDHTDQVRLLRSEQAHALTSAVLDAAGLIVVTDCAGRITRLNKGCRTLLVNPDSRIGDGIWDVFATGSQRARVHASLHDASGRMRLPAAWEASFKAADGEQRVVSWQATELPGGPSEGAAIVCGTDLTERKHLEQQLLISDRLAALGTLAAGTAHEINNPLAYVKNSVELAGRMIDRLVPKDADIGGLVEQLDTARDGIDRIRKVVQGLRTFCGGEGPELETIDVRNVLETSLKLAHSEIRHSARVVRQYEDVPPIRGNALRLAQVFLNLLINAAQAIPPGHVSYNRITVRARAGHGSVTVEIEDTGSGIPAEHLPHIFDPFFTTKSVGSGMGMGLSVCHNIVTDLGGTISAEPMPERGTLFRVTLPASTELVSQTHPRAVDRGSEPGAVQPLSILIVDDEPRLAKSMSALLFEHRTTVAATGHAVLEACEREHFDVIFCDMLMPEMTGIEVYERLRARGDGTHERVVFLTGGAFTDHAHKFLASVSNRVITKPFTLEQITEVLDEIARRKNSVAQFPSQPAQA